MNRPVFVLRALVVQLPAAPPPHFSLQMLGVLLRTALRRRA